MPLQIAPATAIGTTASRSARNWTGMAGGGRSGVVTQPRLLTLADSIAWRRRCRRHVAGSSSDSLPLAIGSPVRLSGLTCVDFPNVTPTTRQTATDLPTAYTPAQVEAPLYERWVKRRYFEA